MADAVTIFKATYSSVPVYEMPCKGVAVMKRRSDGWLNATQILKVAGFDKPQRTRVLEREVQKGHHEKVQGGYGKYQGTWIPPDRGLSLAKQYGVDQILQPIIDYVPNGGSPPPAPKHVTAAPKGPRTKRTATPAKDGSVSTSASEKAAAKNMGQMLPPPPPSHTPPTPQGRPSRAARNEQSTYVESQLSKVETFDDAASSPPPSETSASRTPSPLASEFEYFGQTVPYNQGVYARMILDYFVTEGASIPTFLISPPHDFDPNVVIDDDGHTALHWACAMGRLRIVKLLLTAGADIFRANAMGQTSLMRSVMFSNNYDLRKFPELFELLHRSTINIDRTDRTVFHYIIDIALQKGKAQAAKYYLDVILERLKEYPAEVQDILNFQDEEGETALTLASRARSKSLVKILLSRGADPKIANRDGMSAEDYILEDERFRSSGMADVGGGRMQPSQGYDQMDPSQQMGDGQPIPPHGGPIGDGDQTMMMQDEQPPPGLGNGDDGMLMAEANGFYAAQVPQQLHYSETGCRITSTIVPEMAEQLELLASAYDEELEEKEKDIAQAHSLLESIRAEVTESQRVTSLLSKQSEELEECTAKEDRLKEELKDKMGKRFRLGWEKYVRDEEDRQKSFVTINKAASNASLNKAADIPADIQRIFSVPSSIPSATSASAEQLTELRKRREELFGRFVQLQAMSGSATSGKLEQYRKLIGLGCGLPPEQVDDALIVSLLESLDNEDDTFAMA